MLTSGSEQRVAVADLGDDVEALLAQQSHDPRTDEHGVLRDDHPDGWTVGERQPLHGPGGHRSADALQRQRLDGLDLDVDQRTAELADQIRDEHLSACGRVTQPTSDHHGQTEDVGVVAHLDDVADMDADSQAAGAVVRLRSAETIAEPSPSSACCRAIAAPNRLGRRVEQRHHAVAERLRHPPTVGLDDLTRLTEVLRHLRHTVRIAGFDEMLRGVRDVGEHDRHGRHRSSLVARARSSDHVPELVDRGLGRPRPAPRDRSALPRSGPRPPPCPPGRTRRRSCRRTRRRRPRSCRSHASST